MLDISKLRDDRISERDVTKQPKKVMTDPPESLAAETRDPALPRHDVVLIGNNIQHFLEVKHWPARELAQQIGVSPQAVSQWLSHQTTPTARRLAQIADVFQVSVDELGRGPAIERATPLRQLDMGLIIDPEGRPKLDESSAKAGAWQVPREVMNGGDVRSDVAVLMVKDNALDPDLRVGDYVFADVACRTVVVPGIYLLVIAGAPAWKHCHPLLSDKVQVADRVIKQEVSAEDLTVLARAVRLLVQPSRSLM
jgi:transcriptional regulator with XRE-family HTH domain